MRVIAAAAALTLTAAVGGCGVLPGSGGGHYRMSAYFAKAPSLYKESRVKVMGADVGTVTAIEVEGSQVRVDFTIEDGVSVPADVRASIEAAETLGDRSVVLSPTWKPGLPKAAPGTVIPRERTTLPVEIDEALEAFTRLNSAVDPKKLGDLLHTGAEALNGKGQSINDALGLTADLAHDLAGQDQKLVRIATGLRELAADLNHRDVGATIDAFASASGMLSSERRRLRAFLTGLSDVIRKSGVLITAYQETLPATAADLSNIVMTLKSGSDSINQVIKAVSQFADVLVDSWDRKNHVAVIRLQLTATVRVWLQPVFDALGWGRVPCPKDNPELADCPATPKKGKTS